MTGASNFLNEDLIVNRWTLFPATISHIGELLITCKGTIGTMAFNSIGDIHIARQIMSISSKYINLNYLKLYLEIYVSELEKAARSIIPGISRNDILTSVFPVPPLNEQARIVEFIKSITPSISLFGKKQTELIQLNDTVKPTLKKSILQEAIQGRLVAQCETDEPASVLLDKIRAEKKSLVKEGKLKKSALEDSVIFKGDENKYYEKCGKDLFCIDDEIPFEIPNSWEWVRFGSLINMRMGKTPARGDVNYWTNGKTPWVSISDMFDYGIIKNTKEKVSDFAIQTAFGGNIVPKGTLIMSFKLTVGRTSLLDIDAVHNEAIISIRPYVDKEDSLRDYLFYVLPLISNFGDSKDAIKGKTLNSTSLFNLLIPLPPLAEQKRIVTAIVTAWQVL